MWSRVLVRYNWSKENSHTNKYGVLIDSRDGSSNIDDNVSVLWISSVYKWITPEGSLVQIVFFLQKGNEQVSGGILYINDVSIF